MTNTGRIAGKTVMYLVLVVFGVLMIMPFYWMIVTSFQIPQNLRTFPPKWLPRPPTLEHFAAAFEQAPFFLYYRNSLIVSSIHVVLSVLLGLLAGYAFAIYRFPLKGFFFILILSTLMVPIQVTSVSLYILMARLGWIDTFAGILAPDIASAFSVFFMTQTIKSIPGDLIDAARIDGAREIRIVLTVVAPLVKTVIATITLILFINSWNDFLWPVIVINSQRLRTLSVGIAFFKDPYQIAFGPLMAATTIATMPMILVYIGLQRFVIKGIATTGLKF